jgi:Domain of Unknown Function (DUF928)
MRNAKWIVTGIALGFLPTWHVMADAPPATQPATQSDSGDDDIIVGYQGPPSIKDAITTRTEGAGTRGLVSDPNLIVQAYTPQQTGLTTLAQPRLVWYLNEPTLVKLRVTISDEAKHTTNILWETDGATSTPAGIHLLELNGGDFALTPGETYSWFVSVMEDPTTPDPNPSKGSIRWSDPSNGQGHAYYDSIASAVAVLNRAEKTGNASRADRAKGAIAELLTDVKLPSPQVMDVIVDQEKAPANP